MSFSRKSHKNDKVSNFRGISRQNTKRDMLKNKRVRKINKGFGHN